MKTPQLPSLPATLSKSPAWTPLAALGVVYGDIGTSPLYALRECFSPHFGVELTPAHVLGVLSLIFWALILIVSLKYQALVLRADNRGEGGILALLALLNPWRSLGQGRTASVLMALGIFGAALLYCDGMITPAISVLSAVEGLKIAAPGSEPFVVPLTLIILALLFSLQRFGTARVGAVFGPVMFVWFTTLAVLGIKGIGHNPDVLVAINPWYGLHFLVTEGRIGLLVLGGVFLVVTGAEALYADLGHFGRRPIRQAWFALVLPALVLNYLGQGALVLAEPTAIENPFYALAPRWALYPLVALATLATVIASQALISGVFSLVRQSIQLGVMPRMRLIQTSSSEIGQIYAPAANFALMLACMALVVTFRTSGNLAAAYGVAITITMLITSCLLYFTMRRVWLWSGLVAGVLAGSMITIELPFLIANLHKLHEGGWVTLGAAAVLFFIMRTWDEGRRNLITRLRAESEPLDTLFDRLDHHAPVRLPGTAIFLTAPRLGAPPSLQYLMRHTHALHERVILLTVLIEETPRVPPAQRIEWTPLGHGFDRLLIHYGFMQSPDLPAALAQARRAGLSIDLADTTFFIGRETLVIDRNISWFRRLRERIYAFMFRNSMRAIDFYKIPPERAVEIGIWVAAEPPATGVI
ncbi:MAG TPA: potassium transporter Kup [Candidatus Acidoferrales bacterium]|nr:potassium transporter Kup [Candidatus Acidoferrales bacterium]